MGQVAQQLPLLGDRAAQPPGEVFQRAAEGAEFVLAAHQLGGHQGFQRLGGQCAGLVAQAFQRRDQQPVQPRAEQQRQQHRQQVDAQRGQQGLVLPGMKTIRQAQDQQVALLAERHADNRQRLGAAADGPLVVTGAAQPVNILVIELARRQGLQMVIDQHRPAGLALQQRVAPLQKRRLAAPLGVGGLGGVAFQRLARLRGEKRGLSIDMGAEVVAGADHRDTERRQQHAQPPEQRVAAGNRASGHQLSSRVSR